MALFALPGDGPCAVGAAFAEQDERQQDGIGTGGMHLDQFLDDQFFEAQVGVDDRAGDESAIELVVEHLLGQLGGGVREDAQFKPWMGGTHGLQGAGQVQGGEGFHGADAQFADAFAHLAHGARRLPFQRQHAAGVVEQHAAGGGEFQTTPLAEEKLGTQFLLQLADAAGDVGLHGVQLARGGQDAAFLDDGLEGAEGDQFHGVISIKERFVLDKSFVQII